MGGRKGVAIYYPNPGQGLNMSVYIRVAFGIWAVALIQSSGEAQYRAAIGCSAEKIDSMKPTATLEELECTCFNKCSTPPPPRNDGERLFRTYEGRDINGSDYARIRNTNFEVCVGRCKNDKQCVAYSFDKWNRDCYLKHALPTSLRIEPNSIVGVISTASPAVSRDRVVIEKFYNKSFYDRAYREIANTSYNGCIDTCNREDKCEVLTFSKAASTCKLISRPAEWWADSSSDSGIKRQAAP